MISSAIKDRDIYQIEEEATKNMVFGTNQEWYGKRWQRMAGCGPSTVTNIIYYLYRNRNLECCSNLTQKECLELMNEVWRYVTPSFGGISSTSMLCKGVRKYIAAKNINMELDNIDIPKKIEDRPELRLVLQFLRKALDNDTPIAFLNLDHGSVEELDSWHWVTIVALEYEEDEEKAFVEIMDNGLILRIDLVKWYQTTKLGGGFVSFELK